MRKTSLGKVQLGVLAVKFEMRNFVGIAGGQPGGCAPHQNDGAVTMSFAKAPGYGAVAKILHWLIFILLAVQYAIGSIMPHIGPQDAG